MALSAKNIQNFMSYPATVKVFDRIDSTNNEAKRRYMPDDGCCLYVADTQTAGRGRLGRSFYSPKGSGLYMTAALPITGAPDSITRITCAAATATARAIESLCSVRCDIKWVNDLYVSGRKVCGILCELLLDVHNRPCAVIVGIGVNLTTADFPEELRQRAGSVGDIDRERLCARIADRLIDAYQQLSSHRFLEEYRQRSIVLGRTIRYIQGDVEHTALAVDIDENGGLIVDEGGTVKTLSSGEISVIM